MAIPIVLAILFLAPPWIFVGVGALLLSVAQGEICAITTRRGLVSHAVWISLPLSWAWMAAILTRTSLAVPTG